MNKKETNIARLFGNFKKSSLTISEQMNRFSLGIKAENNPEHLSPKERSEVLSLLEIMRIEKYGDPVLIVEFKSFVNTVFTAKEIVFGY